MKILSSMLQKGMNLQILTHCAHAEMHVNHGFQRKGKRGKNIYNDIFVCP